MMSLLITLTFLLGLSAHAFVVRPAPGRTTPLSMGFFDGLSKAFSNEKYGAPPDAVKANARHILVKSKEDVNMILDKLQNGESWNLLANQYSTCPSKSQGGSLGSFSPGTMVAEFDKVIFSPETRIGEIMGPVETKFGYHLIVVDKRTGGGDWY
jgi:peptidyl-prolyl cis-trans isomerase C